MTIQGVGFLSLMLVLSGCGMFRDTTDYPTYACFQRSFEGSDILVCYPVVVEEEAVKPGPEMHGV